MHVGIKEVVKVLVHLQRVVCNRRWRRRKLSSLIVRAQLIDHHLIRVRINAGERRRGRVEVVHLVDGWWRHAKLLLRLWLRHGRRWKRLVLNELRREGVVAALKTSCVRWLGVFQLTHLAQVVTATAGWIADVVGQRCALFRRVIHRHPVHEVNARHVRHRVALRVVAGRLIRSVHGQRVAGGARAIFEARHLHVGDATVRLLLDHRRRLHCLLDTGDRSRSNDDLLLVLLAGVYTARRLR